MILICIILLTSETEHMCIGRFDIHFGEMPIQVFCPYLYRIICLSRVDCGSPLFGLDEFFVKYMNFKYLLPLDFLPFHALNGVFQWTNILNFNLKFNVIYLFLAPTNICSVKKCC